MISLLTNLRLEPNQDRQDQSQQAGISLLLSILILAAVTAVAFSLATIVFIEVRSSGDVIRTEPALYATFGVTEEALFQYKRYYTPSGSGDFDVATCDGPAGSNVCSINGVTLALPGTQPIAFDNSPRVEVVAAGDSVVLPMYSPATSFDQIYGELEIEVLPTSTDPLEYYFVKTGINPGDVTTDPANDPVIIPPPLPYSIQAGDPPVTYDVFESDKQYELVLANNSGSGQDISVSLKTKKIDGIDPQGFPYLGQQVLRIKADYLNLTRIYQVRIPIP